MHKIGVNLTWLRPGKVGGSEEYSVRLLLAAPQDQSIEMVLYCSQGLPAAHPELSERYECKEIPSWAGSKAGRVAGENSWLAKIAASDDLTHHMGGVVPAVRSSIPVVTIHDLQPLELPQNFSTTKRLWLTQMIPRSTQAARTIIVPSEFTSSRLQELLGVDQNKIAVIPQGVTPVPDKSSFEYDTKNVFGDYLLYPAIAYRHKRHHDILDSLKLLNNRGRQVNVVFTGSPGPLDSEIRQRITDLGLTSQVHVLGRVPEAQLEALYRDALSLVFPSEYEGFGNPVLEAMALGCPVITSDTGALVEVAGAAGLTHQCGDPLGLADCVSRIINEDGLRDKLVQAGLNRCDDFDWDSSGQKLIDCYKYALSKSR